eukprot:SAG31_NODE_14237_length_819_cov_1.051389_1_plen_32_part_10
MLGWSRRRELGSPALYAHVVEPDPHVVFVELL